jgi:hypothetical protein
MHQKGVLFRINKRMKENFLHNSTNSGIPDFPEGLFEKVILRIQKEKKFLIIKRRLALFSLILVFSLIGLIPSFYFLRSGFTQSGFGQFVSLIFSDSSVVFTHLSSFIFALLESFPVLALAAFLAVILTLLQSLRFLSQDLKIFLKLKQA